MNRPTWNTRLWQAETLKQVMAKPDAYAPAVARLRQEAEQALTFAPVSVMDKERVPPSGDKHDYMSMGPYWWPNPETADGLPYVRRDGEQNPERNELDNRPLGAVCRHTQTLALAATLFDDDQYAAHAATLLRTWFLDPETRMNPHLEYGQSIPGKCDGRGIGIIDTAGTLPRVVDALELLGTRPVWTAADIAGMQAWMRAYLDWLLHSAHGQDEARAANNHGTYFDMQAVALALYTDQPDTARSILEAVPEKRFAVQIEPDGAQPLELARTNSRGYSLMNTLGYVNLAILGAPLGVDLWERQASAGRGLRLAIDWFIPYIKGEKEWAWQQISTFTADRYAPLFHHAAIQYGEPRYRQIVEQTAAADFTAERLHLTAPAGPQTVRVHADSQVRRDRRT